MKHTLDNIRRVALMCSLAAAMAITPVAIAAASNSQGPGLGTNGNGTGNDYTHHNYGSYNIDTNLGVYLGFCISPGDASPDNPAIANDQYSIVLRGNNSVYAGLAYLAARYATNPSGATIGGNTYSQNDINAALAQIAYLEAGGASEGISNGQTPQNLVSYFDTFISNNPGPWSVSASTSNGVGTVEVTSATGMPVSGVKVLPSDPSQITWTQQVTNGSGTASFNYSGTLTETFSLSSGAPTAEYDEGVAPVGSGGQNMVLDIALGNPKGSVSVTKAKNKVNVRVVKYQSGQTAPYTALPGAVFTLETGAGAVIQSGIESGSAPVDLTEKLYSIQFTVGDSYQLVETTPPPGYELNPTPLTFTVTANDTSTTPLELDFADSLIPSPSPIVSTPQLAIAGGVTLIKYSSTDPSKTPIAGAVFSLSTAAGALLATGITTTTSPLSLNAVAPSIYAGEELELDETQAPPGYQIGGPTLFTVPSQGSSFQVAVADTPDPGPTVFLQKNPKNGDVYLSDGSKIDQLDAQTGAIKGTFAAACSAPISTSTYSAEVWQTCSGNAVGINPANGHVTHNIATGFGSSATNAAVSPSGVVYVGGITGNEMYVAGFNASTGTQISTWDLGPVHSSDPTKYPNFNADSTTFMSITAVGLSQDGTQVFAITQEVNAVSGATHVNLAYLEIETLSTQAVSTGFLAQDAIGPDAIVGAASGAVYVMLDGVFGEGTIAGGALTMFSYQAYVSSLYSFAGLNSVATSPINGDLLTLLGHSVLLSLNSSGGGDGVVGTTVTGANGLATDFGATEYGCAPAAATASIPGAVYQLENAAGTINYGTVTTGSTQVEIDQLVPGGMLPNTTYQLVEITAPAGYDLNSTPVVFTTGINGSLLVVSATDIGTCAPPVSTVTLDKVDSVTNAPVSGATFSLEDAAGNTLVSNISVTGGSLPLNSVYPNFIDGDTYQLVETQAPTGYRLNTAPTVFTLPTDGSPLTVTVADVALHLKVDTHVTSALVGPNAPITDNVAITETGGFGGTLTSTLYGPVALPAGGSCSTLTPAQFLAATQQQVTTATTGDETVPITLTTTSDGCYSWANSLVLSNGLTTTSAVGQAAETAQAVGISVVKYAANDSTETPIPGAVFTLEDASSNVLCTGITTTGIALDLSSACASALVAGSTYELVETHAPTGYYVPNSNVTTFVAPAPGTSLVIAIADPPLPTPTLSTVANGGADVPGSMVSDAITVTGDDNEDGTLTSTLYGPIAPNTSGCGSITSAQWLAAGAITTSQVIGMDGTYQAAASVLTSGCYTWATTLTLSPSNVTVLSPVGQSTETVFAPDAVELVKYSTFDPGQTPLGGAVFTLEDASNNVLATGITTTAGSPVNVANFYAFFVPGDTYQLVETSPPPGFLLGANVTTSFVVPPTGYSVFVNVGDEPIPTPALSTAVTQQAIPAGSASFDAVTLTGTDDEAGTLTAQLFGPISPGPSGCSAITPSQWTSASVQNVSTQPINQDGTFDIVSPPLNAGCYSWQDSVTMTDAALTVTSAVGQSSETLLAFEHVSLVKYASNDSAKTPLGGAVFTLEDSSNNVLATGISTTAGSPTNISNSYQYFVPGDTYQLVETLPSTGYLANANPVTTFTVPSSSNAMTVYISNEPVPPLVVGTNVTQQTLSSGSTSTDSVSLTGTDNEAGTLTAQLFGPVSPGPSGCSAITPSQWTSASVQNVSTQAINHDGSYSVTSAALTAGCYSWQDSVTMTDAALTVTSAVGQPAETTLVVEQINLVNYSTIDPAKTPLGGAVFTLEDSSNNVLATGITTTAGSPTDVSAAYPYLVPGNTYQLVETLPSTGYLANANPVTTFTVTANGQTVFISNEPIPTPLVSTHVTSASLSTGDTSTDSVTLTGTDNEAGTLTAQLFGPVSPGPSGCGAITLSQWTSATVQNIGSQAVTHDDTFTFTSPALTAGCYSWQESLLMTDAGLTVTSAVGQATETAVVSDPVIVAQPTFTPPVAAPTTTTTTTTPPVVAQPAEQPRVPAAPTISTVAASLKSNGSQPMSDSVTIAGLTDQATMTATIYGPIYPGAVSCANVALATWMAGPSRTVETKSVSTDGTYSVVGPLPTTVGCFAWGITLSQNGTVVADSPPTSPNEQTPRTLSAIEGSGFNGVWASEQVSVIAGDSGPGALVVGTKALTPMQLGKNEISLPTLHVAGKYATTTVSGNKKVGSLVIPQSARSLVAWYSDGVSHSLAGTTLIAGHINYNGVAGVFANLTSLKVGDVVYTRGDGNVVTTWRVTAKTMEKKSNLNQAIFKRSLNRQLVLVSCAGPYDASTHNYLDNVVITAEPIMAKAY